MGEYAEYALADAMRRGFGSSGMASPKGRGPRKQCSLCARGIGGGHMGMVSHLREGHKLPRDEAYKIAATPPPERAAHEGEQEQTNDRT